MAVGGNALAHPRTRSCCLVALVLSPSSLCASAQHQRKTWPPLLGTLLGSLAQGAALYAMFGRGGGLAAAAGRAPFVWLGWGPEELFLGAALGKAAYSLTSAAVTGESDTHARLARAALAPHTDAPRMFA